ncbi:Uncharacterised protein [Klebsiella oxytoca]|nr:Uncharacterised protein [Klebsiella oxytoca]
MYLKQGRQIAAFRLDKECKRQGWPACSRCCWIVLVLFNSRSEKWSFWIQNSKVRDISC